MFDTNYKMCRNSGGHRHGTESGEPTAGTWEWFSLMDEAFVQPPCLIASAWDENPSVSKPVSTDSVPSEADDTSEPESCVRVTEPGPAKRNGRMLCWSCMRRPSEMRPGRQES